MTRLDVRIAWRREPFRLDATLRLEHPYTALLGPSGAGKTSLLLAIAGLTRPERAYVALDGEVLADTERGVFRPAHARRIGFVFQDALLFPHLRVRENLLYGFRGTRAERRDAVRHPVVELLELGSLLARRPHELSGGEARRVALARALLAAPRLLLLDEPLSGLQPGLRRAALDHLRRVRDELGVTVLHVSHDVSELLTLTRRFAMLDGGRILGSGDLFDLLADATRFQLADSLGLVNLLPVVVEGHDDEAGTTRVRLGERSLLAPRSANPAGTHHLLHVRPQEVVLAREAPARPLSVRNVLEGRVQELIEHADHVLVRIDVGCPLQVEITKGARRELDLAAGCPVTCLIKTHALAWGAALPGPPAAGALP